MLLYPSGSACRCCGRLSDVAQQDLSHNTHGWIHLQHNGITVSCGRLYSVVLRLKGHNFRTFMADTADIARFRHPSLWLPGGAQTLENLLNDIFRVVAVGSNDSFI